MTLLENALYWKFTIARVSIYSFIVAWGVFKAGTNDYESLNAMTSMQFWSLMGDCAQTVAGVFLAFFDNSIAKMMEGKPAAEAAIAAKNALAIEAKAATTPP